MKYTEKLSRYILIGVYVALAWLAFKFFGNVIAFVILSLVVALLAKPLMRWLRKIRIKGKSVPDTYLAAFTILLIFGVLGGIVAGLAPVVKQVATNISAASVNADFSSISSYLSGFNKSLRGTFKLAPDFQVEVWAFHELTKFFNVGAFGSIIGSAASTFAQIGMGLVSVIFISFFFIRDETLFPRFVAALTPDRASSNMVETMRDVERLLSRYFVGLVIEMGCVGLIDFLGLHFVARLDFNSALGIAFMAGILNIVPYIGPVLGGVLGSLMAVVVKFFDVSAAAPSVGFWAFVLILAAVFLFSQGVDNFIFQPVIYSASVKTGALEIFLVMLLAWYVGGIIGMLVAIPAYTVLRVGLIHFFPDNKFVRTFLQQK